MTKIYYIIGMMGVGKSSIGLGAARHIHIPFVDLDDYIRKKENSSITEIFRTRGEAGFRALESKYLRELDFGDAHYAIVCTGGGTPTHHDNMAFMNKTGTTIFLKTPIKEIIERLKGMDDDRPLLQTMESDNMAAQLTKIYESRLAFYEKAKYTLENIGYDQDVIENLMELIRKDMEAGEK
jgi:shikimate kinase